MQKENKQGLIDLHIHSVFSDGEYYPDQLIKLAKAKGITTMAITDHDTTKGCQYIFSKDASTFDGIHFIPGIELTVKVTKGRMHLLGYGLNVYDTTLNNRLEELDREGRMKIRHLFQVLESDYGLRFTESEIETLLSANHNIGRPDVAKLCIQKGYVQTVDEAFDKYLITSYNKIRGNYKGLSCEEALYLLKQSGALPVLAHPYTLELNKDELRTLMRQMQTLGLKGVEVYHSSQAPEMREICHEIATELGLYESGGSDYHGPTVKPAIELGTGKNNNLKIKKLSLLDHLVT